MEITTMSEAMQLHAKLLKSGQEQIPHNQDLAKLFTFTALAPSGDRSYARLILKSLRTPTSYYWNTMIRAYSESSDPSQSIHLFLKMHNDLHNSPFVMPKPDKFTYPFILKSCSRAKNMKFGKQLHSLVCKMGFGSDRYICNALVHMYSTCHEIDCATKVFDKIPDLDVVSWTSMIDGLVDNGKPIEAITLFEEMLNSSVEANDATAVSVLRACADTGALEVGKTVHKIVEDNRLGRRGNVSTALIDMYAKCGSIDSAKLVFDGIKKKDVFVWTAMIHGFASHGLCKFAVNLFDKMMISGVKPDERTMTAVLTACRNAGWVIEGYKIFKNMRKEYGVRPNLQHYGCMVDLYARTGRLKEAEEFIRNMPIKPDVVLWRSLIWGCKVHGDTERVERLVRELEIDAHDCSSYVLLGNVYAAAGKWQDRATVREAMNREGLVKPPGFSRIEVDGYVHEFIAGDSSHVEAEMIYGKLDEVEEILRGGGYKPEISEVLLEIDDEEKASQLLHHSEKLAVAFGLIKTKPGAQIRIVKNLRSCEDCHSFMKLISKVYQREIIVRDRIRFHHFKNGECSCGNYW